MAKKRAAWERMVYYGVAGSTAATLITTAVDVGMGNANEYAESTTRGDGTALPKKTEQSVTLVTEPTFSFHYKDGDATQAALITANRTGVPVAIKVVRINGGETEFNGDCYLDLDSPGGLKDGMIVSVTCRPTDDGGRDWTTG